LNPDLAYEIVKLAKSSGLRVAAHVRTAHDFHVALEAGVDIMAHTPGFTIGPTEAGEEQYDFLLSDINHPERFLIAKEDAEKAAALGVLVITTMGDPESLPCEDPCATFKKRQARVAANIHKENMATLKKAGVEILIGSDAGEGNSVEEAIALGARGFLSNAELLHSLTFNTPKAIFPKRKIGVLAPGFEGSFVVLEKNPLEDINNLKSVILVFKQGNVLVDRTGGN
jgi:imidazolonepropionase-like amidohydrolase